MSGCFCGTCPSFRRTCLPATQGLAGGRDKTRRRRRESNTLLLYVDGRGTDETASTLAGGLRRRAGVMTPGWRYSCCSAKAFWTRQVPVSSMDIEREMRELGIPGHVNEDVHGDWARTLDLRAGSGEPGWAIITPDGTTPWKHQGRIVPQELTSALDTHLRRCPD